jgi:hypothetical protein
MKLIALERDIWKNSDPSISIDEIPVLTEPIEPSIDEYFSPDSTPAQRKVYLLSSVSAQLYNQQLIDYRDKKKDYKEKRDALGKLATRITNRVHPTKRFYIRHVTNPHEMLRILKEKFCPEDTILKREKTERYQELCQPNTGKDVDKWIVEWEELVDECNIMGIPEVQGEKPLRDFIKATSNIAPTWSDIWEVELIKKPSSDVTTLLQNFRDYHRSNRQKIEAMGGKSKGRGNHGAFPTFQGEVPGSSCEKKCPACGGPHKLSDDWYLFRDKAPSTWKPDTQRKKEIEAKVRADKSLSNNVAKIRESFKGTSSSGEKEGSKGNNLKSASETHESTSPPADFMVVSKSPVSSSTFSSSVPIRRVYPLKKSWILDGGSDTHVCNDEERIFNLRPCREYLYTGDSQARILGYGDCHVFLNKDTKQCRKITLHNVALIPSFHTNIVAQRNLRAKNVFLDDKNCQLTFDGKVYATILDVHQKFVLEYNPLDQATFANHSSRRLKVEKADIKLLHRRFGHANLEALKKLPSASRDLVITGDYPDEIRDDICRQVQAKKKIARVPSERASEPFDLVHFDIMEMELAYNFTVKGLHFYDDCTGMNFFYDLPNKSQATLLRTIKDFVIMVKRQYTYDVRRFHLDGNRGGFISTWNSRSKLLGGTLR